MILAIKCFVIDYLWSTERRLRHMYSRIKEVVEYLADECPGILIALSPDGHISILEEDSETLIAIIELAGNGYHGSFIVNRFCPSPYYINRIREIVNAIIPGKITETKQTIIYSQELNSLLLGSTAEAYLLRNNIRLEKKRNLTLVKENKFNN